MRLGSFFVRLHIYFKANSFEEQVNLRKKSKYAGLWSKPLIGPEVGGVLFM